VIPRRWAEGAWGRAAWDAANRTFWNGGFELSGHIAFTVFLALFPFLIFVGALAGYAGDEVTARDFIQFMFEFTPPDVARTLAPAVWEVMGNHRSDLLTIGAIITLWTASSGIDALRLALNQAYNVEERRPFWWRKLQSVLLVVVAGSVVFVLSLAIVLGPLLWQFFLRFVPFLVGEEVYYTLARYACGLVLLLAASVLMHWALPDRRLHWRQYLPGVLLSTGLWIVFATGYSLYLGTLADYASTYGSLAGVMVTLLFFYASSILFIWGAEFNAALAGEPQAAVKEVPFAEQADSVQGAQGVDGDNARTGGGEPERAAVQRR